MLKRNFKRLTLDEWADEFIKANKGRWRGIDSANAWLRFVETATVSIAQSVRMGEHNDLIEQLGDAFGWLCCFVKRFSKEQHNEFFKFSDPLPKMVWRKFPGMCYRCAHKFTEEEVGQKSYSACVCLATPSASSKEKKTREGRLESARRNKLRPSTIDDWANMIKEIYGPNHRQLSLSAICLHFLEECGEVAQGLRDLRKCKSTAARSKEISKLQDEIADVFSWIFGLLNKLDQILEKSRDYYEPLVKIKLPVINASTVAAKALEEWKGKGKVIP